MDAQRGESLDYAAAANAQSNGSRLALTGGAGRLAI